MPREPGPGLASQVPYRTLPEDPTPHLIVSYSQPATPACRPSTRLAPSEHDCQATATAATAVIRAVCDQGE